MNQVWIIAVAAVVVLAGLASLRVLVAEADRDRRRLQLLLCWLLPVVGPVLVFAVHRSPSSGVDPALDYQRNLDGTTGHHDGD